MAYEKLPPDYDQGVIQKVIERLKASIGLADKEQTQARIDTTEEINDRISKLEEKVAEETGTQTGDQQISMIPPPQNLTVYEFGNWGFAHVDPDFLYKWIGKITGYEFYGDMNTGFDYNKEPYSESGSTRKHFGTDGTTWLLTEDESGPDSFILDRRLVNLVNPLTIQNLTQGTEGTIIAYALLKPKYSINTTISWNNGDLWRIKQYPQNKLFNIGSLCIYYKRFGNFYVRARSVGRGHSYSQFTEETASTGLTSTEEIAAPTFVYPVHGCYLIDGGTVTRTCTLDSADDYVPRCPEHGLVHDWEEIVAGTRQTEHQSLFGFEWCNVEVVFNEVEADDDARTKTFYHVKRWVDDPADTPDTSDSLEEEADVR